MNTTNLSNFHKISIIDTCSIWNLLSSNTLYQAANQSQCIFGCTQFVQYEALHKQRKKLSDNNLKLREKLVLEQRQGKFETHSLSILDLRDLGISKAQKKLGKGELSSIAFALKTRQAFLTDDKKARKLGEEKLGKNMVQTVPLLFGWLTYRHILGDSCKDRVIAEHEKNQADSWSPLTKHFEAIYLIALEYRLSSSNLAN